MLFLILIVVFMAASIIGWTLFLRFQRERKLSEFKINYLRLSSEEENAYHHYLESEKRLQASEMDCERIKEIVSRIKQSIAARKAELRELIGDLRAIKIKQDLKDSESATLDAELAITKLTSEIRTRLVLNNEEKKKILAERMRIKEKQSQVPMFSRETEELCALWENLRSQLEQIEAAFRALDLEAFRRFSEAFIKKRTEEGKLDPEREIINMILLLSNKRSILRVRKKEAAKAPTTESVQQIRKYQRDVKKLESQIVVKSKRMGISIDRVVELKKLFSK